jgi:type 1 fimbria pilin
MSGVGLVGLAAEGNENTFLNDDDATLFRLRQSDTTIEHFAKYYSTQDVAGPSTVATDTKTEFVITLPMEDDGIGSAFIELTLPEIRATR